MPDLSAERARIYAHELSEFATAQANEVAVRLQYGARSIAVVRFSELWPQHARNPQTRRALQAWYLYAFEQHLAEPVAGTVQTINGKEAGRALATVMKQTGVSHTVAVGVITALAQDARILARKTAVARGQLLEAALNARINRLFPLPKLADRQLRPAITAQWYARSFRAVIGPKVLGVPTAPVTPTEVERVGSCLADNQARLLYQDGEPIGLPGEQTWREHASWWWVNQRAHQRERWLRIEGYGAELAITPFGRLPPYLQSRLMYQNPPTDLELNIGQLISGGGASEQAARMFDADLIRPATDAEQRAEKAIFTRGSGTIPLRDMPDLASAVDALRVLQQNNQGGRQKVLGLAYTNRWWSDPRKLKQATEMRSAGVRGRDIATSLGISVGSLYYGLRTSAANSDAVLNQRLLDAQRGAGKRHERSRVARTSRPRNGDREADGRSRGRET